MDLVDRSRLPYFFRTKAMTAAQSAAQKKRYQRDAAKPCILCGGSGRIRGRSVTTRARAGGNASYLKSLRSGQMSMSERGRKGGAPKAITLDDLPAVGSNRGRFADPRGAGGKVKLVDQIL